MRSTENQHVLLALAQFLRNLREQRPLNQDDIDSSVTKEVERVKYTGMFLVLTVIGVGFQW
jgi:hypothetical protein